jgi:hypothetical protein
MGDCGARVKTLVGDLEAHFMPCDVLMLMVKSPHDRQRAKAPAACGGSYARTACLPSRSQSADYRAMGVRTSQNPSHRGTFSPCFVQRTFPSKIILVIFGPHFGIEVKSYVAGLHKYLREIVRTDTAPTLL